MLNGNGTRLESGVIVGSETLTIVATGEQIPVTFTAVPLGITDFQDGKATFISSHEFKGVNNRRVYDVWFPNLSPSEALLREAFPVTDDKTWRAFKRRFLAEMKAPEARRDLDLLAALSHHANFSIGCYCEDESRCTARY